MTPWEFQARADQMQKVVDDITAIQVRETKRFKRMMWTSRALNAALIIVTLINVLSLIARVCRP